MACDFWKNVTNTVSSRVHPQSSEHYKEWLSVILRSAPAESLAQTVEKGKCLSRQSGGGARLRGPCAVGPGTLTLL